MQNGENTARLRGFAKIVTHLGYVESKITATRNPGSSIMTIFFTGLQIVSIISFAALIFSEDLSKSSTISTMGLNGVSARSLEFPSWKLNPTGLFRKSLQGLCLVCQVWMKS